MTRWLAALVVWLVLAGSAAAQAPGQLGPAAPGEPLTAAFLESRGPGELAAQGIVLSRLNLALQLEPVGTRWLVSLIDNSRGQIVASGKIDELPANREAAVVAVTQVVAGLTAQATGRIEPPPPPWTQPPPPGPGAPVGPGLQQALGGVRADREMRERAEAEFNRRSIRFGATYDLRAAGNFTALHSKWTAYQGDIRQKLAAPQFYDMVGRPDLVDSPSNRKTAMVAGFVLGGIGVAVTYGLFVYATVSSFDCDIDGRNCPNRSYTPALLTGAASALSFAIAIYYATHIQPIDDAEAKALANAYNERVRRELGLPVSMHRPVLHDIKLVPYITGQDAGLAIGARF